ncbi:MULTISPECIES: sugar transferase [Micromonospora]|uniref:Sugar transferase involved in LPS biosynthesis (Colanic, teichoic acid) n=1 Tax=Micromonospora yangpuensis TaxID=683228 RepID=A0A1C6UGV3_9ACTN|nr:sugar transferase [Micromonospora yangpuensis]GGM04636.1 sugar transferase [Micromonospora yangpuensis]SCL53202.1 Sugar transferase involved in LPS biosynthesis (colanic, teichoic acid) [Micromonospora yangpuensis]
MSKRLFDIVVAALALLLASPLLLLIAVAVRCDDGGPVFFRQERVGLRGKLFLIHKFRTMRAGPGVLVTSDSDDRITRLGRILRATKLDELPQLYDVLIGRMSLVGPRPEVPRYVHCWPSVARWRILSIRPGITDPAAVAFRNESAHLADQVNPEEHYLSVLLPQKVEMYLRYVETRTILGDLRILLATVRAVLFPAGVPVPRQAPTRPTGLPAAVPDGFDRIGVRAHSDA